MSEAMISGRHETEWITISTDEYESMKATLEILSNPELRKEFFEGKTQAREGKVRKLKDVAKDFGFKFDF